MPLPSSGEDLHQRLGWSDDLYHNGTADLLNRLNLPAPTRSTVVKVAGNGVPGAVGLGADTAAATPAGVILVNPAAAPANLETGSATLLT